MNLLKNNVTPEEARTKLERIACEVYNKMSANPNLHDFCDQQGDHFKTKFVQGFISAIVLVDSYEVCTLYTALYHRATYQDKKKGNLTVVK